MGQILGHARVTVKYSKSKTKYYYLVFICITRAEYFKGQLRILSALGESWDGTKLEPSGVRRGHVRGQRGQGHIEVH